MSLERRLRDSIRAANALRESGSTEPARPITYGDMNKAGAPAPTGEARVDSLDRSRMGVGALESDSTNTAGGAPADSSEGER